MITNTGTITKTSSGITDFTYISNFTNSGTINFNAGNLRLGGIASFTFNNAGALAFNGGAFTSNGGTTFNYNALSTVTGTGTFTNNSLLNLNTNAIFPAGINFVSTATINGVGDLTSTVILSFKGRSTDPVSLPSMPIRHGSMARSTGSLP